MEKNVRAIEQEGLTWGASTFIAVGYGIKKLQINLVVVDDLVSIDDLQQKIESDEDHVQSTDVSGRNSRKWLMDRMLMDMLWVDCCYAEALDVFSLLAGFGCGWHWGFVW